MEKTKRHAFLFLIIIIVALMGFSGCGSSGGGGGGGDDSEPATSTPTPETETFPTKQESITLEAFNSAVNAHEDLADIISWTKQTYNADNVFAAGQLQDELGRTLIYGVMKANDGSDLTAVRHCAEEDCLSALQMDLLDGSRDVKWMTPDGEVPVREIKVPNLLRTYDPDNPEDAVVVNPGDPAWDRSVSKPSPVLKALYMTEEIPFYLKSDRPAVFKVPSSQRRFRVVTPFGGALKLTNEFDDLEDEMRKVGFSDSKYENEFSEWDLDDEFTDMGPEDVLVLYSHGDETKGKKVTGMTVDGNVYGSKHYPSSRMLSKMKSNPQGGPGIVFFAGCRTAEMLPTFDHPWRITIGFDKSISEAATSYAMKTFLRHFQAGKTLTESLDALNADLQTVHPFETRFKAVANTKAFGKIKLDQIGDFDRVGCRDACVSQRDGYCDDGGEGSTSEVCALGTDCYDCGPRSLIETTAIVTVRIPGHYSKTLEPKLPVFSLSGESGKPAEHPSIGFFYDPSLPDPNAGEGKPDLYSSDIFTLILNKELISQETFPITSEDIDEGDKADVLFSTPLINHETTNAPVTFIDVDGSVTLTEFGKTQDELLIGNFSVSILGKQEICDNDDCSENHEMEIEGTITGSFEGTMLNAQ